MVVVRKEWLENPRSEESKFFYSPNLEDLPVFSDLRYYFKKNEVGCYLGRSLQYFGNFSRPFFSFFVFWTYFWIHIQFVIFIDSLEKAQEYTVRPRRLKQAVTSKQIIEIHDITENNDNQSDENISSPIDDCNDDLQTKLKIKTEILELLVNVNKKLNQRIGTEIIEDDDEDSLASARSRNGDLKYIVNTREYQTDSEFGKKYLYLNNVCKTDIKHKQYEHNY